MITLIETRIVNRSLADTWAYVSDFATAAEWDPGIEAAVRTSGDGGVGTTYDVTATFAGSEVALVYEVTAYEPEQRIVLEASSSRVGAVDTIEFTAISDTETRVDYTAVFELGPPLKYVAVFLKPIFNRLGTKALDGLKATLG